MYKLGYLVSHPIQYQAPLLRKLSNQKDIDLTVMFLSDFSVKPHVDKEFNCEIEWDTPLTDGYRHMFLSGGNNCNQPRYTYPLIKNIKDIILSMEIDALWVHGWSNLNLLRAINTGFMNNIPVIVRGEANLITERRSPIIKIIKSKMMDWIIKRTSAFLAIGTWNREFYKYYGVPNDKIFDVPYAVDNEFFQNIAKTRTNEISNLKNMLNLVEGRPIILYASKLTRRKRVFDLVYAYESLSIDGKEPYPYLLIIGDGELSGKLDGYINRLGWDSIKLLGFMNQEEIAKYYTLSDIFVLPSEAEPWGLVVNEAMNAGVAIIVTDEVGSGKDLVKDGINGFVYKVGDIASLVEKIQILLDNRNLLDSMKNESINIINQWSYDQDIIGIESSLRNICKL